MEDGFLEVLHIPWDKSLALKGNHYNVRTVVCTADLPVSNCRVFGIRLLTITVQPS